jgi:uncharacterized protein YndB with AHSA1/START domain
MPPSLDPAPPSGFVLDCDNHTIRFRRLLSASPAEVFAAWTDPDQLACWWDAAGERLERCEIDLVPGGRFLFVSRAHPDHPFAGTYREISPPGRLTFEALGAEGRVLLAASAEGGTDMVVEIACASAEQLEQFAAMGVAAGTSQTLDNLARHLERAEVG